MDPQKIDVLIENQHILEPYELAYSIYLYTILFISLFLTIAIYYFFFSRDTKLSKELRYIFIHGVFTCFGLTVITCLWQIVILPSYIGGYASPISPFAYLGTDGFLFSFWSIWGLSAHLGVTYSLAFFIQTYRLKLSEPIEFIRGIVQWFEDSKNTRNFLNGSLVFHLIYAAVPILCVRINLVQLDKNPTLDELYKAHPSMVLIIASDNPMFVWAICLCAVIAMLEVLFCLKSNWVTFRSVQSTSDLVTNQTFQSQMHLYRLSTVQLLTNVLLFFVPMGITASMLLGFITVGYLGILNICITVLNCPVQSLVAIIGYRKMRVRRNEASSTIETTKIS